MAASALLPHRQVVQARGLLWASDRVANEEIARRCDVDSDTLRRWRSRFAEQGADGVGRIATDRGRMPSLPADTVEEVLKLTRKERPADGSTHWSTRSLAARVGIRKDAVAKIWADHNFKPWKVETFEISNDPHFDDKLIDVVGLYLGPPPGVGVQLRREDPASGAGPNPAVAADEARAGRHHDLMTTSATAPSTCSPR